jgi:hypothetical protein
MEEIIEEDYHSKNCVGCNPELQPMEVQKCICGCED